MQQKPITQRLFTAILLLCILNSCTTYQKVPYFHDLSDTSKPVFVKTVAFKNSGIQPDDILAISIHTIDADITAALNKPATTSPNLASSAPAGIDAQAAVQPPTGYLVDKNGFVDLPYAGKIKLQGLTTEEAKDVIEKEVDKNFNNAIVNVRYANFKITVIGEVARPASYIIPNEKINIFDALGMAGDLTVFGRRENVLLMRDSADGKGLVRLNLNSKDIVSSPYFFLHRNDVIYVEPSKYKVASVDAVRNRNITIIASILSVTAVIFSRLVK